MAKKRRRENEEPEDTYEFIPPEFDEKEFLLKDLYGTKVLMVVTALAIVLGILAACIHRASDGGLWWLGLILILLAIITLRQLLTLFRFRADLIDQKMLLGNYILMFFLSLGVWIIMLNPPFV
jgi:hypothetical protein